MKRSACMLLAGIVLIVATFIADVILGNMINFADASQFGTTQYATIAVEAIALISAIILIVASRKEAKKEKNTETKAN